jgi:hypothetical protein
MRRLNLWTVVVPLGALAVGLGAAPAAPDYHNVQRTIDEIRADWAKPGAAPQPNAPGWNAFFDAMLNEFRTYASAKDENERLASLNRLYRYSRALGAVGWRPGARLHEELRAWLRPRVRLAWAERRLVDSVRGLRATADEGAIENRNRWIKFVDDDLGAALRQYSAATTVLQRQEALKRVYAALNALEAGNQRRPWVPSIELEAALNDLYNVPNLDVSADVATVAPALARDVVQSGPIYRKGYVSQVTAGPKTGFGLLPSNDGIAFYNSQLETSVTPIHDFQNQIASDRRGRQAAKLYYFSATSQDTSEVTIVSTLRTDGLHLGPQFRHNVDAVITSFKQPGRALGRAIAALVGMNQAKITQKVYEGAIGQIRQNVVTEAAELGQEKAAEAQAQVNALLAQYLIGNDAAAIRNLLITRLSLRSLPTNALIGGQLRWRGASDQVGADAPQPAKFAVPDPGVSADLHLGSIMTSLSRGYLQSDAARDVESLMVVTHKVPPDAPPSQGIETAKNVDYPTFLKAVEASQAANDPKELAIRVRRPGRLPEFAADANGNLVALVHDFVLEVPAPPQAAKGGLAGPPARVYRISAPEAEFSIAFKVEPQTEKTPVRLTGRIVDFSPGPGAKVFAINEDEAQAAPLTAFTSAFVLNIFGNKLKGQPIDVPLSNLQLRGFAISSVSPLDPSGWIRVNLVRTSASPGAGIQAPPGAAPVTPAPSPAPNPTAARPTAPAPGPRTSQAPTAAVR